MEEDFQNGEDLQQQALVWKDILAVVDSMMIKCAVKLRLFDAIFSHSSSSPISLSNLASALSIPSSRAIHLRRIIRYLSHLRLIEICPTRDGDSEGEGEGYTLTAASSTYLREGSEKSQAAFVRTFLEEDALISLHGFDA